MTEDLSPELPGARAAMDAERAVRAWAAVERHKIEPRWDHNAEIWYAAPNWGALFPDPVSAVLAAAAVLEGSEPDA